MVGCGRAPIPIEEAEMAALRRLSDCCMQAEPWPYVEAGQNVMVLDGPLKGTVGILISMKARHRLVLSVTLLKRAVAVEIERDWVRPTCPSHPAAIGLHHGA